MNIVSRYMESNLWVYGCRSVVEPENVVGSVKDVLSRLFMLRTLVEVNTILGGADCGEVT